MRRLWLVAGIASVASSGFAVAAESHAGAACGPAGARTLVQDRTARVYSTGGADYGCSVRSSRITRLGPAGSCVGTGSYIGPVALAGQTVAYAVHHCGVDFGFTQVLVRRLSDGAQLGSFAATERSLGPESTDAVSSLVVRPNGAAAWIGTGASIISPKRDTEVRTGHGAQRKLLDAGIQIKTGSLRLHGSRLTWLHGQTVRSATLH